FWRNLPQGMESSFRLALLRAPEQRETVTFQTFSDPPGLWLEVSGYPYESGLILSLRDITPRKWAEEKRDRSNASLVHAQALAHVGSWDYEAASDKNSWSDETF